MPHPFLDGAPFCLSVRSFERILQQCDRASLAGKRDYVLLRLLWGNALRRNEISQLSVRDFDPTTKTLKILGKGRGTQAETIDLGLATVHAIADWLDARGGNSSQDASLFTALDFANTGHRLTGGGLRKIIVRHSESAGIGKQMSPHRIRHSAITAALDVTDGDVRKVQKLSSHKNLNTLMVYDDNRGRDQRDELLVVEYSLLPSLQGFSTDHESRRSAGTAGLGLGKTSSCSIS
ncbi:tyrosine-type recombinase/integrase [Microcoleus sp. Pol12B4]|uniref:tyrosine-type recombinase/integrase n=1 Tax=Microcoleus sp. Pol12B4 TaxID=3055395 RepID=UPI002FD56416